MQNEGGELFWYGWPTGLLLSPVAVIPFLSHQFSMPTKNRVRCDYGGQFHQGLSAQGLAFYGQESALVIGQQKPFLSLSLHHGLQLHFVELEPLLLLAVHPGGQDEEEKLPRLQDKAHSRPDREAEKLHHVASSAIRQEGTSAEIRISGRM